MGLVDVKFASLKQTKPHEYAARFLFGGISTVIAGLIAKRFGPAIGGLFLAFPAIFPAGASLIADHEKKNKQKAGFDGTRRGRVAAGIDAVGASLGALGLIGFAVVLRFGLPRYPTVAVIVAAALVWAAIACTLWLVGKSRLFRFRSKSAALLSASRSETDTRPARR